MKAGDRFLFDNQNGTYSSFLLCEAAGWWFLIDEQHGNLWCSPHKKVTPIQAFGGEIWFDKFRKLPKLIVETYQHLEEDDWFDVMYIVDEQDNDIAKELNPTAESAKKLLIQTNSHFKFEDLEKIS